MHNRIVIIGAGAAGIGMGVLLKRLGLSFIIIDQGDIGASFSRWPAETQFISPSFSGNSFGAVDLNAITPDTSPAFSLYCEHPTGKNYAKYLKALAAHFELPVITSVRVNSVTYDATSNQPFTLDTSKDVRSASHVIWAAGEFHYPNKSAFEGIQHCIHYADVTSWNDFRDHEEYTVIGAYESGIDAAYQLAKQGKKVTIFDANNQISLHGSDSSYSLSPFTRERLRSQGKNITVITSEVVGIEEFEDGYSIFTSDGEKHWSYAKPFNCVGFTSSLQIVKDLFEYNDGVIQLSAIDDSTICPNLFLTGPQVRHGESIFCFIYKFRQRFGIIGEALSKKLNGDAKIRKEIIDYYRAKQFYLDDLSCCEDECTC